MTRTIKIFILLLAASTALTSASVEEKKIETFLRELLSQKVENQGTKEGSPITVMETKLYLKIWADSGSKADKDVSFWEPYTFEDGFHPLGDTAVASHSEPDISSLLVRANEPDALAPPQSFTEIWNDRGSGAYKAVRLLRMNPPSGYTCLGDVAIEGYDNLPNTDVYRCVKTEYVESTGEYDLIWTDKGSGAYGYAAVWANRNDPLSCTGIFANTFSVFGTYDHPDGRPYILKESETQRK